MFKPLRGSSCPSVGLLLYNRDFNFKTLNINPLWLCDKVFRRSRDGQSDSVHIIISIGKQQQQQQRVCPYSLSTGLELFHFN